MTDKLEPLNMHGHANTWEEELLETAGEIERLRTELHRVAESRRGQRERAERAEAENERLRAVIVEYDERHTRLLDDIERWNGTIDTARKMAEQLEAENERLRMRNKTLEDRLDQILVLANLE